MANFTTHPKDMSAGIKNVYYKEFHCQHSDLRISAGQFLPHDKHCGCQAHLTITIKKIGKRCRAKDPHLLSYPTIIKLFNQHNHALDSADALKCKNVSTETKKKILAFFENGHAPYSALESHQMDLQNQYGEDYYVKATDCSLCPDLNWCYKLFHDICEKLYGEFSQDATEVMLQKLSKIKTDNNDSLIYEIDDDGKPIVAVMTPFMKCVHRKINHSSEIVFMDSTGGFDSLQHRVFILMTHSYMGALPLGLVITTTEKADSVAKGLRLLLKLMSPDEVFCGKKNTSNDLD